MARLGMYRIGWVAEGRAASRSDAVRQAVEAASEAHGRLIGAVIASRDLGPSEISRQSGLSRVSVTKALR